MFPTRYFTLRYWAGRYFPREATVTSITSAFIRFTGHAFRRAGPRNDLLES